MIPVNEAKCDDCGKPVEPARIKSSVRPNGIPIGPWQCQSCSDKNDAAFEQALQERQHIKTVQSNQFDTLCNEVDPQLAEAIHRASRS